MRLPRATVPLLSPGRPERVSSVPTRLLGDLLHFFDFFFIFTFYSLLIFCSCPSRSVTLSGSGFKSSSGPGRFLNPLGVGGGGRVS